MARTSSTKSRGAHSINPQGNPPALPEDSRSLTAPGVAPSLRDVNRSKFTKGDRDESIRITQAYNLGVQVSCGVYTEVPKESALWAIEARAWGGISGAGRREGKRYHRGAPDAGSCAYDDLSATEVFGGASDRVHEGQECDTYCSCVCWTKKELRWAELLGKRVLGIDGWKRRGSGTSLHPGAGEGRQTPRTNEPNGALSASK